ncbi:hypothetical protein [Mucilaginibacter pedocola]|uniref:Uncharacterized protein n=1 Tax=Mucilaginibacter pedocola TaxID=1792845 RepID=A0A1S9PIK4_9SPHI|nr:hypothetical protein [Mucilaginibacter pedocola]OOQ60800.1 hypothetical protein BC343_22765 [Mucilaginibacter pedocola]
MKKLSLLLLLALPTLLFTQMANAQRTIMLGRDGVPLANKDYTDVVGSPYLNKEWGDGTVLLENGESLKDLKLKYNVMENILSFTDKPDGSEYGFKEPIKEFTITYNDEDQSVTKRFRSGYNGIYKTTPKSFFEVVADGKTQLLKRNNMGIVMSTVYNSASVTKNFKDDYNYYLVIDGAAQPIKNDPKAIIAKLPEAQQAKLTEYVKTKKLKKADADLAELINYYNTL